MPEPQIRYCTTTDGVSIAYYTMGEGETLLIASNILWGNIQYSPLYLPEYERLGQGIGRTMRVVRYDSRGSGLSDRSSLDFSLEARLRDLDAVVAKAAPPTFALIASPHGTLAAVEYAVRHPDRVSKLILVSPIVDGPAFMQEVNRWDSLRAMASEEWEEYTFTMAAANYGYDKPDMLAGIARRMREAMGPSAVQAYFEQLPSIDVSSSLSSLALPVLVLHRDGANRLRNLERVSPVAAAIPDCLFVHTHGERGELWTQEETDTVEQFLGIAPEPTATEPPASAPSPAPRQQSAGLQIILFTDIEANTELLQRVGDTAWRDVLREHERSTRALLAEHGGTEIKTIGDAFMTSFNSASAAIECAIALQRDIGHDPAQLHAPLRIRIGINAGEPIAEADDLFGTAVTTAARVQSMAKGGEILVTDVVRQLVAGKGFLFDDRGEQVMRGFDDPVRIFAVRIGD